MYDPEVTETYAVMMGPEKLVRIPLGIEEPNMAMVRSHALGSLSAAKACFLSNALDLIPVPLLATRATARTRSRLLSHRALEGPSARKK